MPDDPAMTEAMTATGTRTLEALKDPGNRTVWQQFVARWRPPIISFALRVGLREDEAQDAAQETLIAFCDAYRSGKYDREKGRLRKWLFGIASNQIQSIIRKRPKNEVHPDGGTDETDFFHRIGDQGQLEAIWDEEWSQWIIRHCIEAVRPQFKPKTFKAFELFVVQELPAKEVAEQLKMTENAVFLAKHRVLKCIREMHRELLEL